MTLRRLAAMTALIAGLTATPATASPLGPSTMGTWACAGVDGAAAACVDNPLRLLSGITLPL